MAPAHIAKSDDLVTSPAAVCKGFLEQALQKTEKASPYVLQARSLLTQLEGIPNVHAVAHDESIQDQLIAAAGFSDKAQSHLSPAELAAAIERVLKKIAVKAGDAWREEIVYRFLLTKGDSLGGSMRNITGAVAGRKLCGAIQSALKAAGRSGQVQRSVANAEKIQSITWPRRVLLFDKKPQFIGNSIDVILLDAAAPDLNVPTRLERRQDYIACGELKGGIDPAGADEHWKTANSALARIRSVFEGESRKPDLFFVGAAIEAAMAKEIFRQLKDGRLSYAANLTVPKQLDDLASWLVAL